MSRTFEVLERAQQDQELFRVPAVTKEARVTGRPADGKVTIPDLDAFAREEILKLVQCVFLATDGNGCTGPRRVVFCGIDEGDGSNLLCARVGRSLAEQVKSQVCVVNANLRVPAPNLFDLPSCGNEPQSEYGTAQKFTQRVTDNLCLVSNQFGGARTLGQLQALITDLRSEFTYWVISAAPIGLYSDAALLGQIADGVVLVLEANSTRRVAVRKAKLALEASNIRVLGMVLNNRAFPIPEKIYRRL